MSVLGNNNVSSQMKQIIMSNMHPCEVVDRGSETRLQVGDVFFKFSALWMNNV